MSGKSIVNFGRNVRFKADYYYEPRDEGEVLDILKRHPKGAIRVVGSKHAWSEGIQSKQVVVSLKWMTNVRVFDRDDQSFAAIGGGCQIKKVLAELNQHDLTLPTVGLISEQTIAGATATGTHGSGRNSISHFIREARLACFDPDTGEPIIRSVRDGDELRAARCAMGCMGIVIEVTMPCVSQYHVEERLSAYSDLDQILKNESAKPLQQFFLIPHAPGWLSQERRISDENRRRGAAWLFRIYWFVVFDISLHLVLKTAVSLFRSRWLVHFLMRRVLLNFVFSRWIVTDRSDRALIMEHELFRHLEMEAFVSRSNLREAASFVREIISAADDREFVVSSGVTQKLTDAELVASFESIRGRFTHHYPVCFRRILPDDTLISPTASSDEDWFAISFITYVEPRDDFFAFAKFLADCLSEFFGARLHWGKWYPFTFDQVRKSYPRLDDFRRICAQFDPEGVFRNEFIDARLGFSNLDTPSPDSTDDVGN